MSHIGQTFISDVHPDPCCDEFAKLLTDGIEQVLFFTLGPGGAHGTSECNWFHGDLTCQIGVDLKGHVIDRITYTIKGWRNETPGQDPAGDGIWTDIYYGHRITIEGRLIPEPSTVLVIAAAMSCSARG
jgi:hypothetical protein